MPRHSYLTLKQIERAIDALTVKKRGITVENVRQQLKTGGQTLLQIYIEIIEMRNAGLLSPEQIQALLVLESNPKNKRLLGIEDILKMRYEPKLRALVKVTEPFAESPSAASVKISSSTNGLLQLSDDKLATCSRSLLVKPRAIRFSKPTIFQFTVLQNNDNLSARVEKTTYQTPVKEPQPELYIDGLPFLGLRTYVKPSPSDETLALSPSLKCDA